jgi:hypothetical protein
MDMIKMTKHIRIRVTEDQFRRLADVLIEEEITKSALIREALQNFLEDYYQKKKSEQRFESTSYKARKNEKI